MNAYNARKYFHAPAETGGDLMQFKLELAQQLMSSGEAVAAASGSRKRSRDDIIVHRRVQLPLLPSGNKREVTCKYPDHMSIAGKSSRTKCCCSCDTTKALCQPCFGAHVVAQRKE